MNLGRFTHRIEIQKNRPVVDDEANCVERWDTVAELYADITPISSREYLLADQHAAEITHKIYIRYNSILVVVSYIKVKSTRLTAFYRMQSRPI